MSSHNAEALIATCIDFRLQGYINKWIAENFTAGTFDRVGLGGGVKNFEEIFSQVKIANDLHHIKKLVFINHEDCGAYGKDGTFTKHVHDLKFARNKIEDIYPDLEVRIYYLHLSGKFEEIT